MKKVSIKSGPNPSLWSQAFALCLRRGRVSHCELAQATGMTNTEALEYLQRGSSLGKLRWLGDYAGEHFYDLPRNAIAPTTELERCA